MRLKSSIWVHAYVRRLNAMPVSAMVAKRGDPDAGAVFIKVNTLDGFAQVLRPAIAALEDSDITRFWNKALRGDAVEERAADAYLTRQADFDSDMWIIEVEDRQGRHFLDEYVVTE